MKKLVSILTVMLVAVILLSACKKDGEDARNKFLGIYNAVCTVVYGDEPGVPKTYTLTITKSTAGSSTIRLENINDSGQSINATVIGSTMTINLQQTIMGKSVTGGGGLVKNVLTFNTTLGITGEETESWAQVATKQ